MTIQKARKTLGKRARKLSDNQILDILNMLRLICNKAIDQVIDKVSSGKSLH